MAATITLTITNGPNRGTQFKFTEHDTVVVGRAEECRIRFPTDRDHQRISRHHCLLELSPPWASVRDLGSRKGTFVNGKLIGRREKAETAEEASKFQFAEYVLKDGDEISLGIVTFQIRIADATHCSECGQVIPDVEKPHCLMETGEFCCGMCRKKMAMPATIEYIPGKSRCAQCGQTVARGAGSQDDGAFVCEQCKSDPRKLAELLLDKAKTEPEAFASIQGYRIEKELGKGGMGAVYLAVHEESGQQVALKLMLPQHGTTQHHRELFLREVANTQAMNHRNVVRLFDFGASQGTFFFTLEYCQGGSLFDLLQKRGKPLAIEKAVRLCCSILDGLDYAHNVPLPAVRLADGSMKSARGLVHRDIKPHNIFLAKSGKKFTAKIGDYGLSKAFELAGLSGMSMTGQAAGTPVFMPRQQLLQYRDVQPNVDVWAAAATLYYSLTLSPPRTFPKGQDPWQVLLGTSAVPIRNRNAAIPAELAQVIDWALVDEPAILVSSASELREVLQKTV